MSLFDKVRGFFRRDQPTALRNKAGGLAWINSNIDEGDGSVAMVNRVVRTIRHKGGYWEIDPPQGYRITRAATSVRGHFFRPADAAMSIAIRDECLTPIQGDVTDEEVRELFAPKQPEVA